MQLLIGYFLQWLIINNYKYPYYIAIYIFCNFVP